MYHMHDGTACRDVLVRGIRLFGTQCFGVRQSRVDIHIVSHRRKPREPGRAGTHKILPSLVGLLRGRSQTLLLLSSNQMEEVMHPFRT